MRRSIPTLVLIAAMATAIFLWVPAEAHAQHSRHRYGHGYQQGYGHGYGHRYGHGYRHGYRHGYGNGYRTYGSYGYEPYRCDCGSVRIELVPNELRQEAQVYVDGAHAGVFDDFDGIFQRLSLRPGQYEIEIRLDGYRTFRRQVLVSRGRTYRVRHRIEPDARVSAPAHEAAG